MGSLQSSPSDPHSTRPAAVAQSAPSSPPPSLNATTDTQPPGRLPVSGCWTWSPGSLPDFNVPGHMCMPPQCPAFADFALCGAAKDLESLGGPPADSTTSPAASEENTPTRPRPHSTSSQAQAPSGEGRRSGQRGPRRTTGRRRPGPPKRQQRGRTARHATAAMHPKWQCPRGAPHRRRPSAGRPPPRPRTSQPHLRKEVGDTRGTLDNLRASGSGPDGPRPLGPENRQTHELTVQHECTADPDEWED